jgi:hypothetical protein
MIAYIDNPPTIEPRSDGFSFKSGGTETQLFLTLYAMSGLCGKGMLRVKEAQAKTAMFEPTPFKPKQRRR